MILGPQLEYFVQKLFTKNSSRLPSVNVTSKSPPCPIGSSSVAPALTEPSEVRSRGQYITLKVKKCFIGLEKVNLIKLFINKKSV